ncbi:hypothetical protein GQ53DRAFT_723820 [Thozetella sp. PMI_491]|nr:hypothetical protein GQ53DRAFT_723820 [Thozetella sp. PMI_491]
MAPRDEMTFTFTGPDGPTTATFGEATAEQQIQCLKLAAAAWSTPLSEEDYMERDIFLNQRPLFRDGGGHCWCLFQKDNPLNVFASCKTIPRDILVRDTNGTRKESAFCIASVVTNPRHRKLGLSSLLLKCVADWMDGPGNAAASMLSTSIGDFYAKRGWKMERPFQSTLSQPKTFPSNEISLPATRPLTSEDIPGLCVRDVDRIQNLFKDLEVGPQEVHMAVAPTTEIITWLQDRAAFTCDKLHGRTPKHHGSLCESADIWIYWIHDFQKQQLAVQRVAGDIGESPEQTEGIAKLFLDALLEAAEWKLPKVVVWNPSAGLLRGIKLLEERYGVEVVTEERIGRSIPSVRWRDSDETRTIVVQLCEFYTWS